jgi:hypothetical protein
MIYACLRSFLIFGYQLCCTFIVIIKKYTLSLCCTSNFILSLWASVREAIKNQKCQAWWPVPVIPAIKEAAEADTVGASPGKK